MYNYKYSTQSEAMTMYYIGIDLGGTNIAVGIVDENYKMILKGSTPTPKNGGADAIVADIANLCKKLVADSGLTFEDIASAGIGIPGSIDLRNGTIVNTNNLPFKDYPMCEALMSAMPVKKVYLENDANAAALGEVVAGAARGAKHAVMITLGTGVGGGVVIDGKLYSGFNFAGVEIGHMVIEEGGKPCNCGRLGCFESYASATGLINMTTEKIDECKASGRATLMTEFAEKAGKVSGRTAFDAMRAGDEAAREVVDTFISYLGCGLANVVNIFQPEILIIGGGICNEREYLTNPLDEYLRRYTYPVPEDIRTKLKIAELGNDAGIIGAAALGV